MSTNEQIDYVRNYYGVPAEINGRVRYTWRGERLGTIVGADDARLLILLDGDTEPGPYHPTWEIEYLIHVDQRTDRDGNEWTRTANPKPWRGMGGINLSDAELDARGPLTDTSYFITRWPAAEAVAAR